jgi:nucleobase:cation symporter-1, NCS1 family
MRARRSVGSRAGPADAVLGFEVHGLEPIPQEHRHGHPRELFWTWLGGNFNYPIISAGALTIIFGLGIRQALAAALVGSLAGAVILGLCSLLGPRTATATIVNTRAALGLNGNYPAALLSWLSVSGWVGVNAVLAVFALLTLASSLGMGSGVAVKVVALVVVLLAQVAIAVFGHATVVASERVLFIFNAILFSGVMVFVLPRVDWSFAGGHLAGGTVTGTWLLALSVVFAVPISWINYASDYSRYLAADTSPGRVMLWASLGMGVSCILGSFVGITLATVVDMSNPVANLPRILPGWYLAPFLLVVILGATANNVLNIYTAGLGLLALRVDVRRWLAVCLVALIATVPTVIAVFLFNFMSLYDEWLSLTLIFLTPWGAILVTDYLLRRGRYVPEALHTWGSGPYWYRRGFNWPALGVLAVAMLAAVAVAHSTLWQSPVSRSWLGGADLSLFAGLVVASALYYVVARRRLRVAGGQAARAAAAAGTGNRT